MPPQKFTIVKGTKVGFGCSAAGVPNTYGFVTSVSKSKVPKEKEVLNEDGQVIDIIIYDVSTSYNIAILIRKDATPPDLGEEITIGPVKAIVRQVDENWTQEDTTKLTLNCTNFANLATATE